MGILTNPSGIDRHGKRTIDILARDAAKEIAGLEVDTLFSPEHGISGNLDTAHSNGGHDYTISNSVDRSTGLPVVSLFGNTENDRRPKEKQLRNLDVVVIDLQDVGARFYTYETLTGYFVKAAEKTHTTVMILDRPNPVRGDIVQGPTSAPRSDYLNLMSIPLRHGLTLGELSRFYKLRKGLHTNVVVVQMEGWRRDEWFDETGLPWRNPSPNLRSMDALILYSGIGMLETTNISVGRGTDTPFTIFGAPWVDSKQVIKQLERKHLGGLAFEPYEFTPQEPFKFAHILCHGVLLRITDRNLVDAPTLGAAIASILQKDFPKTFRVRDIDPLKVDDHFNDAIEQGRPIDAMTDSWSAKIEQFRRQRAGILLY